MESSSFNGNSLAEFRRRYPNEQIPAILHKLEQDAQR